MKSNFVLFIAILHSAISEAQINYNEFRASDFKFRSLTLNTDGAFSRSTAKTNLLDGLTKDNRTSLNYNANLWTYANKQYSQTVTNFDFNGGFFQLTNLTSQFSFKSTAFVQGFFLNHNQRKYKNNSRYLETGIQSGIRYNHNTFSSNESQNELNLSLAVPVRWGKGRIDPASPIYLVSFLNDQLVKNNVVENDLNQDEQFELARLIQSLQNTRMLDARRNFINQDIEVGHWLQKKLKAGADIVHAMAIVQDHLRFANVTNRYAGQRKDIGLAGYGQRLSPSSIVNFGDQQSILGIEGFFENFKSVSQTRHRSNISINRFTAGIQRDLINNQSSPYLMGSAQYGIIVNPNTRSNVELQFGLKGIAASNVINTSNNPESYYYSITPGLQFAGNYFINYNTYLKINLGFSYSYDNVKTYFNPDRTHYDQVGLSAFFPARFPSNLKNFGFNTGISFFHALY
ncbi:MAG: hypothetical protein KA143_07570 [Saprospiraceae bacterium]|nr:hypothetical protein [Saprospiraceae bacterium]